MKVLEHNNNQAETLLRLSPIEPKVDEATQSQSYMALTGKGIHFSKLRENSVI